MTAKKSDKSHNLTDLRRSAAWVSLVERTKEKPNMLLEMGGHAGNEGLHSRMLAWLLNPKGLHGLGSSFLSGFLDALRELQSDLPRVSDVMLATAKVKREEHNPEGGKVDINIEVGDVKIGIENKIGSPVSKDSKDRDQLDKYASALAKIGGQLLVFLTPDGVAPIKKIKVTSDVPIVPLSYRATIYPLLTEITASANPPAPSDHRALAARMLVADYIDALERSICPNKTTISLCRQFFRDEPQLAQLLTETPCEVFESVAPAEWKNARDIFPKVRKTVGHYLLLDVADVLEQSYKWKAVPRADGDMAVFREEWIDRYEAKVRPHPFGERVKIANRTFRVRLKQVERPDWRFELSVGIRDYQLRGRQPFRKIRAHVGADPRLIADELHLLLKKLEPKLHQAGAKD